jgi:preprotein translocase subunit SecG
LASLGVLTFCFFIKSLAFEASNSKKSASQALSKRRSKENNQAKTR